VGKIPQPQSPGLPSRHHGRRRHWRRLQHEFLPDLRLGMNKLIALILVVFCAAHAQAQAQTQMGRWVTFKTGRGSRGPLQHQIDRNSIRQEGRYKSFWIQMWVVREKQALVFTVNEKLFFWSQKFLADCGARRHAARFVDANYGKGAKLRATPQTVRWEGLDK